MSRIDVSTIFGFWPRRRVEMRLEKLLKLMDKHKIDKSLTVCARGMLIDVERGNSETLEAAQKYPKRLIPVATMDPRCGGPVGDIVKKCVDQGFKHIRFFPDIQHWKTDNLVWGDIFEALVNDGRLCLHLPAMMGLGSIDKIAVDYRLPVVVHGSRFGHESELAVLFSRRKNVYAEISYMIGVASLDRLAKLGHGDRLLFGSNALLNYTASAVGVTEAVKDKGLEAKIFAGNAVKLLESLK